MSPQILVLGLPRTGTQSLADAIEHIGYSPVYHMREVGKNDHQSHWVKLIKAKAEGHIDQLTRENFEVILKDYKALADFPASLFGVDLIREYPEAKVIVTVRDENKWYESMLSTLWGHYSDPNVDKSSPMQPLREAYHGYCWQDDFETHGKSYFREYHSAVRAAAAEESTLLWSPADGWQPLCQFLGTEIPETLFPRRDDNAAYKIAPQKPSEQ